MNPKIYKIKLKGNRIQDNNPPKYIVTHIYILVNPTIIQIKGKDRNPEDYFTNLITFFFCTPPNKDVITKQNIKIIM